MANYPTTNFFCLAEMLLQEYAKEKLLQFI